MKRAKFKIALATALVLFNLLICFAGTLSWFVAARTNDAAAMQIQIYTHELDMSYRVYKYDEDLQTGINATGQPNALTFKKYDSVITSRNTNTPIILEFVVTGMNLSDTIPLYINTHCEDTSTTNRVLSNIIQLQFAAITSITSTDANDIYTQAVEYFDENSIQVMTFKNGNNKVQDIVYTLSNYQNALINNSLRLYIKLDYSVDLINAFEFSITDSTTTSFANDLTLINCYTDEN